MTQPVKITVTGAAGNIAYSLLWRIAAGDVYKRQMSNSAGVGNPSAFWVCSVGECPAFPFPIMPD